MSLITAKIITDLCTIARSGVADDGCARYVRIRPETLGRWLDRGWQAATRDDAGQPVPASETLFLRLYREFHRAHAEREAEAVLAVRAKQRGWQAEAFYLERRHARSYGSREARSPVDVIGSDAAFLAHLRDGVTDDPEDLSHDTRGVRADSSGVSPCVPRFPSDRDGDVRDLPVGV